MAGAAAAACRRYLVRVRRGDLRGRAVFRFVRLGGQFESTVGVCNFREPGLLFEDLCLTKFVCLRPRKIN